MSSGFINFSTNVDITHKPKRMQKEVSNDLDVSNSSEIDMGHDKPPQSVTMESAIAYFSDNANGSNANLYKRTSMWLKEYLELKAVVKKSGLGARTNEEGKE